MSKLMIVTVGTSLFVSASWDENCPGLRKELGPRLAKEYQNKWADPGDSHRAGGLYTPLQRQREGKILEPFFTEKLKSENAAMWAAFVASYDSRQNRANMRYSAELATILGFAKQEAGGDWKDFLNAYEICFVHDSKETEVTYRAAIHNQAYLLKLLNGNSNVIKAEPIRNLSDTHPGNLKKALIEYYQFLSQERVKCDCVDIVISGGYKVYGLIANRLLTRTEIRIIYLHETSENVITHDHKSFTIDQEKYEFPGV